MKWGNLVGFGLGWVFLNFEKEGGFYLICSEVYFLIGVKETVC